MKYSVTIKSNIIPLIKTCNHRRWSWRTSPSVLRLSALGKWTWTKGSRYDRLMTVVMMKFLISIVNGIMSISIIITLTFHFPAELSVPPDFQSLAFHQILTRHSPWSNNLKRGKLHLRVFILLLHTLWPHTFTLYVFMLLSCSTHAN